MQCKKCGSQNTVKNGRTRQGNQQYHCRDCGVYTTTDAREQQRQEKMAWVEKLHNERVSQRGIARLTGVSRPTIIAWLRKKAFRPIGRTLTPMMGRPEIEIDEQWSYVGSRQQQVWTWTAVERGSCRVVGFAVGERSEETCRALWQSLPADYRKRALFYTDELNIYRSVLPAKRHRPAPAGSGNLGWCDSLHAILRQHCANLVRKTHSFSRDIQLHATRVRMVVDHHNAACAGLW
jgi:insertion element IS1 protein InsB